MRALLKGVEALLSLREEPRKDAGEFVHQREDCSGESRPLTSFW